MAFETNLVAVSWTHGSYAVVSHIIADVDTELLRKDGRLHDVTENVAYVDEVAVISKPELPKYFLSETSPWSHRARDWYAALPKETMFVLVHRAEWESGMND